MSYTVSCGFTDLSGTCEINSSNEVTSYSCSLGTPTIEQLGGTGLHCKLTFTVGTPPNQTTETYHIHANPSGTGYSGHAKDKDGFSDTEETWAATSTGEPAVAAKAY
jgi:hypothetical protein